MQAKDIMVKLQFTNQWLELGIISVEQLEQIWQEYEKGTDPHPEHYRWRAFESFLKNQPTLEASLFIEIYAICESDVDIALANSMKHTLLKRADCPIDLIEKAALSENPSIVRLAQRLLDTRMKRG